MLACQLMAGINLISQRLLSSWPWSRTLTYLEENSENTLRTGVENDTKIYTPRICVNRDLRVHPRSKSALATQNAGSTPWRAFALKTRDDGGQVVLPGPVDRGEGGPREGRVRPKPHRNRSSPRRHLGLDQGHGRLGESRERERGLLSFVGATDGSLTPRILPLPFHWHLDDRASRSLSATFPFS